MSSIPTISNINKPTDADMLRINQTTAGRMAEMGKAKKLPKGASMDKINETANEFEAQFISQMLENMFSTVETNDVLGGGEAEETYRSMMIDEYGKLISRSGGIGVADHVKREMIKLQEVEK